MSREYPRGGIAIFDEFPGDELAWTHEPLFSLKIHSSLMHEGDIAYRANGVAELSERNVLHRAAGTVWRCYGEIPLTPGFTVIGDELDPISFCLIKDRGAIHLTGKGRVISGDGKTLFEAR